VNARVLIDFFDGRVSPEALAAEAASAFKVSTSDSRRLDWRDLQADFQITTHHLVLLCDAVVAGHLSGMSLEAIAFGMIADDHFLWDTDTEEGDRIGDVLNDWSAPEINFALNAVTLAKFRHYLVTGERTLTKADHFNASA
jgi:hypothetical protein